MPNVIAPPKTAEDILAIGRSYQDAAVLLAAAELDVFGALHGDARTADELARQLGCDRRGIITLLDAVTSLGLLQKTGARYSLPRGLEASLTRGGSQTVLAMLQHQANCLRNWAQLAKVVKTGHPAERTPSVRGKAGDQESFIAAMDNISGPMASQVIQAVQPARFEHLLDVGGASGTWTIAFLRSCSSGRATIFALPHVVPMAQRRLATAGVLERVQLVPGDFMVDSLPPGADLAWVSAIVHQNSREQNRLLFGKVFQALVPGGRIAIRDIVMENSRTQPVGGALFAINMLVATEGGGTFTFEELREDLESAGFVETAILRRDVSMNSIVAARRPASGAVRKADTIP
jgi:precorrin-6B methylase 2